MLRSKVWLWPAMDAWHFVSVNKKDSKEIKNLFGGTGRGFGSIPITGTVGKTKWNTSIFPDKKSNTYVLPLKKEIRKKEDIEVGKTISFSIEIRI